MNSIFVMTHNEIACMPKHQTVTYARVVVDCLDFDQVAMPMVHLTTGETISSYKQLMHNPAMAETWQTAFGKDFWSMAQGDNKMG
jgi:hypothetical protein